MGIRIHKVLGYGLTDVETSDLTITDPRIRADCPTLSYEGPSIEDYQSWLEQGDVETDLELALLRDRVEEEEPRPLSLDDAVVYDSEYGLPNVLVICPPTYQRKWCRHDDDIDYIEAIHLDPRRERHEPPANRIEVLRHGPYPWNGLYMDRRTGGQVSFSIMHWIRATNSPDGQFDTVELDLLAKAAGFTSSEDAWANVAPAVPNDVRNLVRFLGLFTDDQVWRQLRPMLYTYWA